MSRPLTSTGLTMPPDFHVEPYEAVLDVLRQNRESAPDAWREFASGWGALSFRFAALVEHDEAFTRSAETDGLAPQPPARFRQEDELFAFFAAGMSALETFAYGTWAIVWATGDANFALSTLEQRRKVKLRSLRARLVERQDRDASLAEALDELVTSRDFNDWAEVRNALTHRGGPGRTISTGEMSSTAWGEMHLDGQTTTLRRAWLATALGVLLSAAERFAHDHF